MRHVVFDSTLGCPVQTRSCDHCFSRKIKCDRRSPCSSCLENDTPCRYERPRKKRRFLRPDSAAPSDVQGAPSQRLSRGPSEALATFSEQQDQQLWATAPSQNEAVPSTIVQEEAPAVTLEEDDAINASGVTASPMYLGGDYDALALGMGESFYYSNIFEGTELPGWAPQLPIRVSESPHPGLSPFPLIVSNQSTNADRHLFDSSVPQLIEIFLERLQHSMPFFTRSFLRQNVASQRHIHDRSFGSLVQAICSLVLLQPVQSREERPWPNREARADAHLALAVRLHSQANLGQSPTLETIMTSVFLFACQFCKGNFDAARFRLREASALAEVMKLDKPESYGHVSDTEKQRRIRTFIGLTIIERIYSVQRDYIPGANILSRNKLKELQDAIASSPDRSESENIIALEGLDSMLEQVDFIDTNMIKCWKSMCWKETPQSHVSQSTILSLLRRYQVPPPLSWLADVDTHAQHADILVTRHWMRIKLWTLANSHSYVAAQSEHPELRREHALTIASEALDTCSQFQMTSLEVHGVGLVEKLSDIATCAALQIDAISATSPPLQDYPLGWDPNHLNDSRTSPPSMCGSPSGSDSQMSQFLSMAENTLNGYLALFASFRRGRHPFLRPYMRLLGDIDFQR